MVFGWDFIIDMYEHFYQIENDLFVQKLFYMTLSCTIFIYYIKESDVSRENLYYSFDMQIETTSF